MIASNLQDDYDGRIHSNFHDLKKRGRTCPRHIYWQFVRNNCIIN